MKIAIFTETFLPQVNGVVRTLEKIIVHLESNGHQVLLFTPGEGEETYSGTRLVRLEAVPFYLYPELNVVKPYKKWYSKLLENPALQAPIAVWQCWFPNGHEAVERELEVFKPDLVHLVTPATLGAIGGYYVEKYSLPCLATFHTDLAAYAPRYKLPYLKNIINRLTKFLYRKSTRVLAPCNDSKVMLEGVGLNNIGIWGRGVDSVLFDPIKRNRSTLANFNLDCSKLTICYVGRLADEKSIPDLIQVAAHLSESYEFQLLFIGDGPARPKLEKMTKEAELDFAFTGILKGEELATLFASGDIFAFPSKTETFGQVVQEAMASGLPVVGYKSPGVSDLIQHGKTGFLCEPSLADFEENLEKLVADQYLREIFGRAGRLRVINRTWEAVLDALIEEYENLLL